MTRHPVDRRAPATAAKTLAFLEISRKSTLHPAVLALRRRPRGARMGDKLVQFLRIARDRTG